MKKVLLLFTVLFIVQTTVAQPPEYFVDNWYLHSFYYDGQEVFINTLDLTEGPTLIINNDFTLNGNSFCNNYNGTFEYISFAPLAVHDNFIPRNIIRETEECGDFEGMESFFFLPFMEEKTAEIYVIVPSGSEKFIVLQYDIGYQVYKNFPALGLNDVSINNLIVFPNPAKDKIIIQSSISNFDSVSVSDLNGRIVISDINSKEIDVSGLKSGMYFLNITSAEGNITKKFIKN